MVGGNLTGYLWSIHVYSRLETTFSFEDLNCYLPVTRVPALRDHEEDEIDEQHGIVQPQRDEHDEPGPPDRFTDISKHLSLRVKKYRGPPELVQHFRL
jgi:hypothetical protein